MKLKTEKPEKNDFKNKKKLVEKEKYFEKFQNLRKYFAPPPAPLKGRVH